jgi:hypothetical protein
VGSRLYATGWLLLQLGLGLLWAFVLASRARGEAALGFTPLQVLTMLLIAGWLPSIALAAWQVRHRRWRALILSDLLGSCLLVLLACTAYLPLFFVQVVWFLPYALLPRGVLSETLMCCLATWHKRH